MSITEQHIRELTKSVNAFGESVKDLQKDRDRFLVGLGIVVLGLVCVVMWLLVWIVPHIDRNTKTTKSVQCSFYKLVLTSGYRPDTRIDKTKSFAENKDNLRTYNNGYRTIVLDNNRLGCVRAQEPTMYISDPSKVTTTTTKGK